MSRRSRPPWALAAAGPLYSLVYRRRGLREAERQLAGLLGLPELAGLRPGARVLDVGSGTGRHLRAAAARGLRPLGVERSAAALCGARRRGAGASTPGTPTPGTQPLGTQPAGAVVRAAAARLPLAPASFDLVWSLFSAFAQDGRPAAAGELRELARVLVPGGCLVLDLPEPSRVRAGLLPRSRTRLGALVLDERRRIGQDGTSVHKRVVLARGPDRVARWFEHLALFEAPEIRSLLLDAGLEPLRVGPAPDVGGFGADRLLAVARRRGAVAPLD